MEADAPVSSAGTAFEIDLGSTVSTAFEMRSRQPKLSKTKRLGIVSNSRFAIFELRKDVTACPMYLYTDDT